MAETRAAAEMTGASSVTGRLMAFYNGSGSDVAGAMIIHKLASGTKRGVFINVTIKPGDAGYVREPQFDDGVQEVEIYFMQNEILQKTAKALRADWSKFTSDTIWLNLYSNNINISCDGSTVQDVSKWGQA